MISDSFTKYQVVTCKIMFIFLLNCCGLWAWSRTLNCFCSCLCVLLSTSLVPCYGQTNNGIEHIIVVSFWPVCIKTLGCLKTLNSIEKIEVFWINLFISFKWTHELCDRRIEYEACRLQDDKLTWWLIVSRPTSKRCITQYSFSTFGELAPHLPI